MPATKTRHEGSVRIIGGQWRGSKLPVPDLAGLRPSADRVRETLFNWLAFDLSGACVLDAFAGSGALGFEALSRGAAHAVLIETTPQVVDSLRQTAQRLKAEGITIVQADALQWLARPADQQFDIVFLDPPYASQLLGQAVSALTPWLAKTSLIYIESASDQALSVPAHWRLHRQGSTQQTQYRLYRNAAI